MSIVLTEFAPTITQVGIGTDGAESILVNRRSHIGGMAHPFFPDLEGEIRLVQVEPEHALVHIKRGPIRKEITRGREVAQSFGARAMQTCRGHTSMIVEKPI
jgi:hypothetical protein